MQLQQISTYIDLLLRWNTRINLTAIRDPEEIVTRHFGESLFLARHLFPDPANVERALLPAQTGPEGLSATLAPQDSIPPGKVSVLDIGSGAGFPGLPLKIWTPDIYLTLIESNHKKAAFLREVIRTLTLTNVNVLAARAESLIGTHPPIHVVTMRAVERFETILPIAEKLTSPSGRLALLIGTSQLPVLNSHTTLRWNTPIPLPGSNSRLVAIGVSPSDSGIVS